MPVDPDARKILDAIADEPQPPPDELDVNDLRRTSAAAWPRQGPGAPVGRVYERTVPGPAGPMRARIFVPDGTGPFPLLVWFHGGGWVIGTPEENEGALRELCRLTPSVVLTVQYRLAPEHRYPAAAYDAYAALCWAARHAAELGADPARIAIGGESAGGNLAAVCALMARDRRARRGRGSDAPGGPEIALQVLVSPVLGAPGDGRDSYVDFADGYFITAATMRYFFAQYPRTAGDLDEPYLLPLRSTNLAGLPPALIFTAEYDVLRDEGEEYARRLAQAGVPTELCRVGGMIHGFFGLLDEHLPTAAAAAHRKAADALAAAFAASCSPDAPPAS